MEIERKFLFASRSFLPLLASADRTEMVQGYLNSSPVIRIRKEGEEYFLTYKGEGLIAREEVNLLLNAQSFSRLLLKCDGNIITKTRYRLPLPRDEGRKPLEAEIDIFSGHLKGLILIEVEFPSTESAKAFLPPDWFGKEVSTDRRYQNVSLSMMDKEAVEELLAEEPSGKENQKGAG